MINHDYEKIKDFKNDAERTDLKGLPESKEWINLSMLIMFISLIIVEDGINCSK